MALRVEFDSANKILLLRFEGSLTDESIAEFYKVIRQYWTAADASMGIVDFSTITHFELSSALIRQMSEREPCMPDATNRPRVIVAPKTHVFWVISHVPNHGRVYEAAPESHAYLGRGGI
jgi:hypothetical protein